MGLAGAIGLCGCGAQYRPVVSAINPVGPAGQPTKYAVAVSNTSTAPTQVAISGYSITGNVATFFVSGAFNAGESVTLSGFTTSTFLNNLVVTVLSTGLSSTQFEANVTHANVALTESGTATVPGVVLPGLLTFVDVSGDSILSTPSILPFPSPTAPATTNTPPTPVLINPNMFTINSSGTQGFVVNAQGTFEDFGLSNPTGLLTQNIVSTTLSPGAGPSGLQVFSLPSTGTTIFVPEQANSVLSELAISNGPSLLQNFTVPSPVYTVGVDGAQRVYTISGNGAGNGSVYPIENSPVSISGNPIPVGVNPVYGVMTADGNRAFILNKGSGTVSVINVPSNGLDAGSPTITIPGIVSGGFTSAPNPVWADFAAVNSEMVVLNQGDGTHPGSVSVINIPLCNANTPVTNPNCNTANPVDAVGFGTVVGNVNVGVSPTMVSVLADGSRAYVVNGTDPKCVLSGDGKTHEGSVSVVNLVTMQLSSTICGTSFPANMLQPSTSPTLIYGHPNTIAATTGNPTGKVYVTSSDSSYLTVIETDTDTVDTHISLQGLGVRVVVTAK